MTVAHLLRLRARVTLPLRFHAGFCRLFSLRRELQGAPVTDRRVFYVSNHVSYLDVFVLGASLQGMFVAKKEVASWPVFGKLAAMQSTLFVERNPRRTADQVELIRSHLGHTGNLIVFPEGTSTAGHDVAQFRSSLFAGADRSVIQAITLAYRDYNGRLMSEEERFYYAWYLPNPKTDPTPNRPLLMHMLSCLGFKPCTVVVKFHAPVTMDQFESRKACALHCEQTVRDSLHEIIETV